MHSGELIAKKIIMEHPTDPISNKMKKNLEALLIHHCHNVFYGYVNENMLHNAAKYLSQHINYNKGWSTQWVE